MSVPTGAKIIKNKFASRCFACKQQVEGEAGAAVLLPGDIRWRSYHPTCLPAPYEEADIPATVTPTTGYHHGPIRPVTNPAHARCATCAHWMADHTPTGCNGQFRGAPGCTCYGYATVNGQPNPSQVQTLLNANLISQSTAQAQIGVSRAGRGTPQRLIVFSGPIRSASDGDTHLVTPDNVLRLHGLNVDRLPDCTVLFYGADEKADYHPGPEDFVIGPRYKSSEYDDAEQALAIWLVQKGITR